MTPEEKTKLALDYGKAGEAVLEAKAAYGRALVERDRLRNALGEAGLLPCAAISCGASATKKYRCNRWFCTPLHHYKSCGSWPDEES